MKIKVNRESLLHSFESLQKQFDSSLEAAKRNEQHFEALRKKFMEQMSAHLHASRNSLSETNPMREQIIGFIEIMEKTRAEWDNKIAGREKGVKFRAGFEDSLLVFVSGKVKSGKSSLGNYMAWGHTDPNKELEQNVSSRLEPQYFSYAKTNVKGGDATNEAQENREFRVGATEATSSIQGFSLPGLTWVDSPGLHSLNKENENLARSYVEHADLILYTMKSDSPGRESDISEITQLVHKDKKLLLLLTGSDDVEVDFDDETNTLIQHIVMKDVERCAKQRSHVQDTLIKNNNAESIRNIEIVSLSARYAQLNIDNPQAFDESGMGQLCQTLHRISQADGVRIKQQVPGTNMRNFLQNCHNDLKPYHELISSFTQPLDDLKKDLFTKLNSHVRRGQSSLIQFVDDFFDQIAGQRNIPSVVTQQLASLPHALDNRFQEITEECLTKIFEETQRGFRSAVESTYARSNLLQLPDFKLENITEQIPVVQEGTSRRNAGLGSIFGGVVGFALGGPAGAALGAVAGGGLGGATGQNTQTNYREIDITVGDNLQDIRQQVMRDGQNKLEADIRTSANTLWVAMESDITQLLKQLQHEVELFEGQLKQLLKNTSAI